MSPSRQQQDGSPVLAPIYSKDMPPRGAPDYAASLGSGSPLPQVKMPKVAKGAAPAVNGKKHTSHSGKKLEVANLASQRRKKGRAKRNKKGSNTGAADVDDANASDASDEFSDDDELLSPRAQMMVEVCPQSQIPF